MLSAHSKSPVACMLCNLLASTIVSSPAGAGAGCKTLGELYAVPQQHTSSLVWNKGFGNTSLWKAPLEKQVNKKTR